MYSDTDKVYIYKMDRFFTLYDFSAQEGDEWEIPYGHEHFLYEGDDGTSFVQVASVGEIEIQSERLRYFTLEQRLGDPFCWGFNTTLIVEKIGPVDDYMLPNPTCVFDLYAGGPLRCYLLNGEVIYKNPNYSHECNYVTNILETKENAFHIAPNPAQNTVTIHCVNDKLFNIVIVNLFGQTVFEKKNIQNTERIHLDNLESGLYFILLTDNKKHKTIQKLIKS